MSAMRARVDAWGEVQPCAIKGGRGRSRARGAATSHSERALTPLALLQRDRAGLRLLPSASAPTPLSPLGLRHELTLFPLLSQCVVTWPIGSHVAVNWLGPPAGDVSVSLVSNVGGPTYTILASTPGTSQEGYCDSGYGKGVLAPGHECGRVEFVVPEDWQQMENCASLFSLSLSLSLSLSTALRPHN